MNVKLQLLFMLMLCFCFSSCEKADMLTYKLNISSHNISGLKTAINSDDDAIILGNKLENPYSVENFSKARVARGLPPQLGDGPPVSTVTHLVEYTGYDKICIPWSTVFNAFTADVTSVSLLKEKLLMQNPNINKRDLTELFKCYGY